MVMPQGASRKTKLIQPERQDTYRNRGKLQEPTVCTGCGAAFTDGRWSWKAAPRDAAKAVCSACHRIADRFPAGRVEIGGPYFKERREEILAIVRNVEAAEKKERPMERIMAVAEEGGFAVVTTTGIHLARRIGESLSRSCQGTLDFQYGDGEDSVRVNWSR